MTKRKEITYKGALEELEDIISKIEGGDTDLDELSTMVKKATSLIKTCKNKLRNTEVDLEKILEDPS